MAHVEIQNLAKSYGSAQVMSGINLSVAEGEFVILVGPSGCGKSTLLRMIAGLEPISGGTLSIGDRVVNDVAPKERNIAMVFQSYALYPHKTVEENMGFSLKLSGRPKAEIKQAVTRAAESLDLAHLLDRLPKHLSGGQRQRVAMGRAIVRQPEVFLFDEPLSNLDAKLRVQMRTEIRALHRRLGTTTVYVTHDQVEAMTMADRIVVLNKGGIEQVGTPMELYNRPGNLFVAAFIGSPSMNFFEGRAEPEGLRLASGLLIPTPTGLLPQGQEVVLGVRPEHITVATAPTAGERQVTATVEEQEPTGAETLLVCDVGGVQVMVVMPGQGRFAVGDQVTLSLQSSPLHVFDKASGTRLGD